MEALNSALPIAVYILLIILIIIAIILGIKLILTLNKVDKVVDNVETKVNSLNDLFDIVEVTTGKFSAAYNKVCDVVSGIVDKILTKKAKDVIDEEGDEEDE